MNLDETMIKVKSVKKYFKSVKAVDGIDLEIKKGEFVALLGPNGAGKTTLVEMIEGIQKPDEGEISIDGKTWMLDPGHRSYVEDFGVYLETDDENGKRTLALSRQMVLFCVERRKAWRLLQSRAGVTNLDYEAQRAVLTALDENPVAKDQVIDTARDLLILQLTEA